MLVCRNWVLCFLDNISAAVLSTPGMCDAEILTSKNAEKNHRHLSKCMTMGSLEDPLLMTSTRPLLSR